MHFDIFLVKNKKKKSALHAQIVNNCFGRDDCYLWEFKLLLGLTIRLKFSFYHSSWTDFMVIYNFSVVFESWNGQINFTIRLSTHETLRVLSNVRAVICFQLGRSLQRGQYLTGSDICGARRSISTRLGQIQEKTWLSTLW